MYDIIIIGAGPAGISAALYAKRANKNVLVIYNSISNLEKATKIDNYYGFPDGIEGSKLFENGIEQAKNLGVEVIKKEIVSVEMIGAGNFKVKSTDMDFEGKSVIIATGDKKFAPNIKGVTELEGRGISYCAICDSFFFRNKKIGVIGSGKFAISEADVLKNVTDDITILTNGMKAEFELQGENREEQNDDEQTRNSSNNKDLLRSREGNYKVETRKISEIFGEQKVEGIKFEDGESENFDGIFIAMGEAGAMDFAKTLGILIEGTNIKVDEDMRTNIPGIFACGNITGGLLQVCKAVCDGAKAGLSAVNFVNTGVNA